MPPPADALIQSGFLASNIPAMTRQPSAHRQTFTPWFRRLKTGIIFPYLNIFHSVGFPWRQKRTLTVLLRESRPPLAA
jgi:hypothetical protein